MLLPLVAGWLGCFGAVAAEAAFSGKREREREREKRKKKEGRSGCSRQSIYVYVHGRPVYMYLALSIYVYMGYVRTEKIFWTCTSGGSCRIMLRRQLVWVLKMEWHRTGHSHRSSSQSRTKVFRMNPWTETPAKRRVFVKPRRSFRRFFFFFFLEIERTFRDYRAANFYVFSRIQTCFTFRRAETFPISTGNADVYVETS